ncbi:MAG: nucleotide sugar dehydrogenase, partial [Dehalococcoidia bacterium]|nr:nucleotide sugar dehydrogenase [Dehalococcoidia bacterium]
LEPAERFPPARVDALIIQALHDAYRDLDLRSFQGCRAVLDGRNALEPSTVEAAGMRYLGIGR